MIVNHVSNLEGPLMYLFMRPRKTIALAKRELWEHPVMRKLMQWWETIPIDRTGMDRAAMDECFAVIKRGDILCLAPEGTRSKHGMLQQGKDGVGYIAGKALVPILPVSHYGIEDFSRNIKRLRRTSVTITVGKPFVIELGGRRLSSDVRQAITDEMMRRLAETLPEAYRGFYADRMDEPYTFTRNM